MKKILTFLSVALMFASVGLVGCGGGAADNSTTKTDTSGKAPPKDSKSETDADAEGKKRETAAGGEAKTETPPD